MPISNDHLTRANGTPDDEFYTRPPDVAAEIAHHADWLAGKSVWCNCDDPKRSAFAAHFRSEFGALGLRDLICTGYDLETGEPVGWRAGGGKVEGGDFRELLGLLEDADVIVTNPPFRLFRENLHMALGAGRDILMLGGQTIVNRSDVFPLIRDRRLMCGGAVTGFDSPNGPRAVQARWYGTLPDTARHSGVEITRFRDPMVHRRYDDYPAIDVPRVSDIPADWGGEMGVPVTFLAHWNPEQFRVTGMLNAGGGTAKGTLDGGNPFARLLIVHRDLAGETQRLEAAMLDAVERDEWLATAHARMAM